MDNRYFPLDKLPIDILQNEVPTHLDKKDILHFSQTSKSNHKLFRTPLEVAKLLHYAQQANYETVEKMVSEDPALIFQHIDDKNADGKSISPLKFAFKVYDTYMWNLFWNTIQHNPTYVKYFLSQLEEQTEHLNLDEFFNAYHVYDIKYIQWMYSDISSLDLDNALLLVGKLQKNLLPMHMLKEFCLENFIWGVNNYSFDSKMGSLQKTYRAFDFDSCQYFSLDTATLNRLGKEFTIVRGRWIHRAAIGWTKSFVPSWHENIVYDLNRFKDLFKQRSAELAQFKLDHMIANRNSFANPKS